MTKEEQVVMNMNMDNWDYGFKDATKLKRCSICKHLNDTFINKKCIRCYIVGDEKIK